jgi:hypothetical protein
MGKKRALGCGIALPVAVTVGNGLTGVRVGTIGVEVGTVGVSV